MFLVLLYSILNLIKKGYFVIKVIFYNCVTVSIVTDYDFFGLFVFAFKLFVYLPQLCEFCFLFFLEEDELLGAAELTASAAGSERITGC